MHTKFLSENLKRERPFVLHSNRWREQYWGDQKEIGYEVMELNNYALDKVK
jgi:hypothetical protein